MLILDSDRSIYLEAIENCHCILLGGDTMNEKRYLWWNFVASDMDLIEIAKKNCVSKKIKMPVDDEKDFIPLPN